MTPAKLWAWLRRLVTYEPAVVAWAVNGGIAVLAAWVFNLTSTEEAAVSTIVTGLAAVYTAASARPSDVTGIIGALTTVVTAAAAFGFHPAARWIAVGTAAASIVLPLVLRVNLTPVAAIRHQTPIWPVGFGPVKPAPIPDPPQAERLPPREWRDWPVG